MAAYAALVSLMNNIEQIQRHTRLPIHFDPKQSESLLDKVRFLIHFLESYNHRGAGEKMKDLESRIRDAAYAAEDIIETHVVNRIHAHSRSSKGENKIVARTSLDLPDIEKLMEAMKISLMQSRSPINTTHPSSSIPVGKKRLMRKFKKNVPTISAKNPTLSCLEKVMEDMDFIMKESMKLKDRNETQDPIMGPSISSTPAGKNTIVGFDDELKRITERLSARERSRQVISIVGMGGIGKTTLAKTAYEKLEGGKHFDFCAWVSISQEYDLKKIVLGLLPKESSQMSDNELGQTLHKRLYGRRYLIVLDDMWSVKAWEMVQLFLPDNSIGSRIIVTTRESSVCNCFDSSSLKMSFLDENQSWDLFCETVFAPNSCPHELEEVGRKIVNNCKGLPLSIVVIGGLLAKSKRRKEHWESIARDTKTSIKLADNEQCIKLLSLSYQNLPVHLKPCFLYISAFPEDRKISASLLIYLWVAEGFLKSECSKELEELAETYLNDLISRNLILVHTRGDNGKVKYCMVHDLLRDLCLKVVKNEKFMYASNTCIQDEIQFIGSHRRISFHNSSSSRVLSTHKSGSMPLTRTLLCDFDELLPLQYFKLLRVVNCIETVENVGTSTGIYPQTYTLKLVNSRLIAIPTTTIHSSICLSWNLQILIVGQDIAAPPEIWEMSELRHLESQGRLLLPGPPPNQQMNTQKGDAIMNLHTLYSILNFRFTDEAVQRIPNIKKLKIYYELTRMELEEMGLKSLCLLVNLESLNLELHKQRTASDLLSHLTFPNSLKELSLWGCRLQWKDMSKIASIPHLEMLKLKNGSFIGPKWELDEEVFSCLKSLVISKCEDLVQWIAEDVHFPCLEYLRLKWLDKLVEIPSGIGELPTLQRIVLDRCSHSAVISAKKILKEQEDLGNLGIRIIIYCYKSDELETFKSDNFLVIIR